MKHNYISTVLAISLLLSGCSGCTKSGRRLKIHKSQETNPPREERIIPGDKTTVKFNKRGGVLEIPAELNGVPMNFIFDTGASDIMISSEEAENLYSIGKLTDDDFIGVGDFTDANGNISQGKIINLSSVKIGNRVLKNIRASINQHQNAPLLFGQTALIKFGKVSIDYNQEVIVFE
jgi:aspartyl protease family protein